MPKPDRDEVYRLVACPKCKRPAGQRCYTVRAQSEMGFQFPTAEPHKSRVDAYRKQQHG